MAKESGLGMTVSVDDSGGSLRDLSNDITNIDWATPRGVQDVTGLDKSGIERLLLLADGTGTISGVFNDAANMSHAVFKTVSSTSVDRTVTIAVSGQTLSMECVLSDYSIARAATGELTYSVPFALANGTVPTWS